MRLLPCNALKIAENTEKIQKNKNRTRYECGFENVYLVYITPQKTIPKYRMR